MVKRLSQVSSVALLAAVVAGCGGSSDNSTGSDSAQTGDTGRFSLAVTDAPVDSAAHVVVSFAGVSIQPADGQRIEFTFDEPKNIDLLALQGDLSEPILTDEEVPAGDYEWIRLHVNAEGDGVLDSYIEFEDGTQLELWVPSGSETGLKLVNGFTVAAGAGANFTIDFDLRKSINNPRGMPEAILKPSLRLIDNTNVGSLEGSIDATLVSQQCVNASEDDGAVYLYSGANATPVDVQGADTDPLANALVKFEDGAYRYELGFLPEGDYTVTYTCEAGNDDPTAEDTIAFSGTANVAVTADSTVTHDFTGTDGESATDQETTDESAGNDTTTGDSTEGETEGSAEQPVT